MLLAKRSTQLGSTAKSRALAAACPSLEWSRPASLPNTPGIDTDVRAFRGHEYQPTAPVQEEGI